ncbi:hypothetical protein DUNSADRAFT_5228 [Dunaliella salina]|uniref:Encoded protein n=1 Tax=Dunaliella salina TaxID=3046 RepID=A0ABQ7FV60_DUNSA|nr:hypothetical protein DUNSADRAFT_5228 [Dunaliella salina]|eukprot:KAF5826046.1 hypothetical protein DUNSADRAFT_5228 [Dunaliella salina]
MILGRTGSHEHVCVPTCRLTFAGVCAGKERDKRKKAAPAGWPAWMQRERHMEIKYKYRARHSHTCASSLPLRVVVGPCKYLVPSKPGAVLKHRLDGPGVFSWLVAAFLNV